MTILPLPLTQGGGPGLCWLALRDLFVQLVPGGRARGQVADSLWPVIRLAARAAADQSTMAPGARLRL